MLARSKLSGFPRTPANPRALTPREGGGCGNGFQNPFDLPLPAEDGRDSESGKLIAASSGVVSASGRGSGNRLPETRRSHRLVCRWGNRAGRLGWGYAC